MRRSSYERRLKRYKKLLDEQNAVGYQRHFISAGRRIKRAAIVLNAEK